MKWKTAWRSSRKAAAVATCITTTKASAKPTARCSAFRSSVENNYLKRLEHQRCPLQIQWSIREVESTKIGYAYWISTCCWSTAVAKVAAFSRTSSDVCCCLLNRCKAFPVSIRLPRWEQRKPRATLFKFKDVQKRNKLSSVMRGIARDIQSRIAGPVNTFCAMTVAAVPNPAATEIYNSTTQNKSNQHAQNYTRANSTKK